MLNPQCSIKINSLRLYGHHGVTEKEQKVGSWYEIDLTIDADISPAALEHDDLQGTIDYSAVLRIVKDEFAIPSKLLEHFANRVSHAILHSFDRALTVTICVHKIAPPMPGNIHSVAVRLTISKEEQQHPQNI